jgi:hypothetical protein
VPIHASREIRNYVSGFPLDEPQKEEGKATRATSEINQSQERTRVGEDTIWWCPHPH